MLGPENESAMHQLRTYIQSLLSPRKICRRFRRANDQSRLGLGECSWNSGGGHPGATICSRRESITPLARNEWICWVLSVKKPETRRQHVERVCKELREGCADLVAGPVALTVNMTIRDSFSHGENAARR